jgi:hypothetical protein
MNLHGLVSGASFCETTMIPHWHPWFPALRAAALACLLAASAAAKVELRLDGPKEPVDSLQEVALVAEVTGAGNETGVLWSAREVVETEGVPEYLGVWPGIGKVRFEPDGPGARAIFAAPGRSGGLRTFQIRAASAKHPKVFKRIWVNVRPPQEGAVETKKQDVPRIPGGGAGKAAQETKASETCEAERVGLAWETPFRVEAEGTDEAFVPAAFRFHEGQPRLIGEWQRRRGGDFVPARIGVDNDPEALLTDGTLSRSYRSASTLACLGDGRVVMAEDNGLRIRRIDLDGTSVVLAGSGEDGWNGDVDESGQPRRALEAHLKVAGPIVALQDGSVVFVDSHDGRIRRITPEETIETLAGGGHGQVFRGDGQDLGRERPALDMVLPGIASLTATPDGSLVFAAVGGGIFSLAPDGVLHRLETATYGGLVAMTADDRLVCTRAQEWKTGRIVEGLYQLAPGREPVEAFTLLSDTVSGPLVASPCLPLGRIQRMMPVPGGGLLVATSCSGSVWYLSPPGKDLELAAWIRRLCAAVAEAEGPGDLDLPWRGRAELARVAVLDPRLPGVLPPFQLKALARDEKALKAARSKDGKVLPDVLWNYIYRFMDTQALVLKARIALHVLDRKIAALPEEKREAFAAYRPAGMAVEAKDDAGAERKAEAGGDGEDGS